MIKDFEKFKQLVTKIYQINKAGTDWINKIPAEISSLLLENTYASSLGHICDLLITEYFEEYAEDVFWLMYEFEEGKSYQLEINDKQYTISSLEDYFDAIKEHFN